MANGLDSHSLEHLMRAAQAGNTEAYGRLLREVTPRLYAFIKRQRPFLPSEDIEDLIQDVLMSIHAVRATYDPDRPFMPWLVAIARNRLVDAARRYARHKAHEQSVAEYPVTFSEESTNIEQDGFGDPGALHRAIKMLPKGQREAVEMLKLREMSLKEAAAASGASINALKVSVHRAMTTLRKVMNKE
jgi:RNA polymerase sigma-70 factor (ECF subfamily)